MKDNTILCFFRYYALFVVSFVGANIPLTYKELADLHLPAYGIETHSSVMQDGEQKEPSFEVILGSESAQREQLYALLSGKAIDYQNKTIPFYDSVRRMIRDLELLCGSSDNPEKSVLQVLDRTHTLSGQLGLIRLLVHPTRDIQTLTQRQEFIGYLVKHEEVLHKLEVLLTQFKQAEPYILALWDRPDSITSEYLDKHIYFGKWLDTLNKHKSTLEVGTRGKHLLMGAHSTWVWATPFWFPIYWKYLTDFFHDHFNGTRTRSFKKSLSATLDMFRNAPSNIKNLWKLRSEDPRLNILFAMGGVYGALWIGSSIWTTYQYYREFNENCKAINCFQTHFSNVTKGLDAAASVWDVLQDIDESKDMLIYGDEWASIFNVDKSALSQLRTSTFRGKPSYFSYIGKVLELARDKEALGGELLPLLEVIGELDAYVSLAKLYKEYQNKPASLCFVEYSDAAKPCIDVKGIWNCFVHPTCVVKNDLYIGNEYNTMLLTGSNTGGKSTLLKALGLNLVLAQTCGLSCADTMKITPFGLLTSSLNITDNTAQGISLFKAEVLRAQAIKSDVQQLSSLECGFVMLDELFNGTNATSGSRAAYEFVQTITEQYPNILILFATHFLPVTLLEQETKGRCRNYKMDVYLNSDGTVVRPFKLEAGISKVDVAQQLVDTIS